VRVLCENVRGIQIEALIPVRYPVVPLLNKLPNGGVVCCF
jgi:hypothetical protein